MTLLTIRNLLIVLLLFTSGVSVLAEETSPPATPTLATYAAEERKFQDELLLKMQRMIKWELKGESLSTLAERLKKELDCEVLIDQVALEDLGIDFDQPVKATYSRISLQQALEHSLQPLELDWVIRGRALVISTQEECDTQMIVRVYDVRDLVVTGNFGHGEFDSLIDSIIATVAADSWAENGGGEAEIRPFHVDKTYALIISQTFRVQRQIEQLLNDLRKLRDPTSADAKPAISLEELQASLKLFDKELPSDKADVKPMGLLEMGTPQFEDAIARSNDFSLDLFRKTGDRDINQFMSGYSAREMLTTASFGSGGETRKQFEQVLRLPSSQEAAAVENLSMRSAIHTKSPGNELLVANAVWIAKGLPIQPQFRTLANTYMQATVTPVDFAESARTAERINRWAAANTRNRITNVVDAHLVEQSDPCILTNAVYFLGEWEFKFSRENTKPRDFRLASGESVQVPTMQGHFEARAGVDEETGTTIGELFYAKGKKSMVILLPIDRKGALDELEQSLTHEKLQDWLKQLSDDKVNVELPKFQFENRFELKSALSEMGLRDAFNSTKADFKGICNGIHLAWVRQVTYIRVDETGTEAIAFGGGGFGFGRVEPVTDLIVNRPFLFLIRDVRTGCILFVGRVVDPRVGNG